MPQPQQENPNGSLPTGAGGGGPLAALSIRPGEGTVTLLSTLTIFTFFLGYGMIRPLRDAMGVERGFDDIPWLITVTMGVSLAVSPLIAWTVRRIGKSPDGRRRVMGLVFRFFAANLLLFALAKWLTPEVHRFRVGYAFYVWASVFNLTCVGAFWGLMADLHPRERSLRIYGVIAFGATLGLIGGGASAKALAGARVSPIVFFLILAALLEAGARLGALAIQKNPERKRAEGDIAATRAQPHDSAPAAGQNRGTASDPAPAPRTPAGPLSGIRAVLTSPYLLAVCGYMLIYTVTSTFFYLAQQRIVLAAGADTAARTGMNATIDLWANGATLAVQLLLTGRIMKWIGQGGALAATPIVTLAGLAWLGQSPALGALIPAVVARRSVHYAVDRPGREALYTVIPPDQKYTAKSFIDTFVYRGGDVLGAWVETAMKSTNTPLVALAGPLCLLGAGLGAWLGGKSNAREASSGGAEAQD